MSEKPEDKTWSGVLKVAAAFAAAIGGPVLGGLGLKEWANTHKLLAVIVVLIYEAVVFFAYLIGKIWKRLEDRWIDALSQWVDYRVQALISRYRRKYLQHMVYECRDFDVKGLTTQGTFTLELQRVFVELSVDTSPSHRTTANPIPKLPARLEEGQHEIWEYLETGRNLALIGAPGSGKTTLLRHIALVLALRRRQMKGKLATRRPTLLPVLLFLRYHAKSVSEKPELTLPALIESSTMVKSVGKSCPGGWFERQLQKGRCLVLLDGLDEVADPEVRRKLVNWLDGHMRTYAKNLFLVTSRPYGYLSNPLSSVNTLSVRPFSPSQVRAFVSNWYLSNEIISRNREDLGVRKEAEKGAEDLMRRIRSSTVLTELAVNPLLLTMIATVHRYRSELPGRRVELYREICEVFLGKRQDVREVERAINLTPSQKQCVLEPLAYHMMRERTREIDLATAAHVVEPILKRVSPTTTPADFFKMIENTSGLLLEKENEVYEFAHKTFQEYLAAVHCRNERLLIELTNYVYDEWWHETIRLYVAQADGTPIFEMCLRGDPPPSAAIALAVECLDEAQQVDEKLRERLHQILTCETEDEHQRRVYGEALLALRLRRMIAVDEDCWIDTDFVTQAEYQVFLDEMRARGRYLEPDHWKSYRFQPGDGTRPVIGVTGLSAESFCKWLTDRDTAWEYRLPAANEDYLQTSIPIYHQFNLEVTGCWTTNGHSEPLFIAGIPEHLKEEYYISIKKFLFQLFHDDWITVEASARDTVYEDLNDEARHLKNKLEIAIDRNVASNHLDRFTIAYNVFIALTDAVDMAARDGDKLTDVFSMIKEIESIISAPIISEESFAHALPLVHLVRREINRGIYFPRSRVPARIHARSLEYVFNELTGSNNQYLIDQDSARVSILLIAAKAIKTLNGLTRFTPPEKGLVQRISYFLRLVISREETRRTGVTDEIHKDLMEMLSYYVQLSLIEGRRQDKIPVLGGIRIVRERREAKREYKTPKIEVISASAAFQ